MAECAGSCGASHALNHNGRIIGERTLCSSSDVFAHGLNERIPVAGFYQPNTGTYPLHVARDRHRLGTRSGAWGAPKRRVAMSRIPDAKYSVKLTTNTWADGVLDTTADPPTYALDSGGDAVEVSNWHPSTDKVGWTVTLTPSDAGESLSITFFGGHFNANKKPVIQRGKARGFPPGTRDDPQDTWTADAQDLGVEASEPAGD
jgi:hypothetical protein